MDPGAGTTDGGRVGSGSIVGKKVVGNCKSVGSVEGAVVGGSGVDAGGLLGCGVGADSPDTRNDMTFPLGEKLSIFRKVDVIIP